VKGDKVDLEDNEICYATGDKGGTNLGGGLENRRPREGGL